ncbi:hypothetical protein LTR74_010149 [Friedmanniomyces endolithicus]|nr:hypothetical protein LTR74_010149 [Friedmanniomyces endolithicus]
MVNPSTDTLIPAVEGPSQSISSPVLEKTLDLPLETTAHADVDTKAELVAVKKGHAGSEGPKPSGLPRKVSHKSRKPLKKNKEVPVYSSSSDSSDDDFDADLESESSDDEKAMKSKRKSKKAAKHKKRRTSVSSESEADESEEEKAKKRSSGELEKCKKKPSKKTGHKPKPSSDTDASSSDEDAAESSKRGEEAAEKNSKDTRKASKFRKSSLQDVYKRVDEVWNKQDRRTTLRPTVKDDDDNFAEHAFLVRRTFTIKNEYLQTMVDIKSKALRSVLREVLKDCKEASLDVEEPELYARTLFYYLEDLRTYCRTTMRRRLESERKRKVVKKLRMQRHLCEALVHYLDEEFRDTKKKLYPLLEAGKIDFDLVWTLFKPNDVAIFSCYGVWEEPRCFRIDETTLYLDNKRGHYYKVEGQYLEYDGKEAGWADHAVEFDVFKGPRAINTLDIYPLKYHEHAAEIKDKIVARGKRFVALQGMQYKFHKGIAFQKDKKNKAIRININGRVMVDPLTFRRTLPNYNFSSVRGPIDGRKEPDEAVEQDSEASEQDSSYSEKEPSSSDCESSDRKVRSTRGQRIDPIQKGNTRERRGRALSDDDLLLASPVVLGFSFANKLWLEFSVSGIQDIEYDKGAFESLMLPEKQKEIVRALVKSHKFNAAKGIDDVIRGKGKGLVSVLHGPPGCGKTLTAESISELLKCPLYAVSAGELGTNPAKLEVKLNQILDVAHSWGAVLLLDEADVFLEKREVHDIQRNALVSIFLRMLEYFQGILFLTTNRVDTFDEAFQSRIHLPLRYSELTPKAKKAVWKLFLETVRKTDSADAVAEFTEHDLDALSRRQLIGRQIKNAVRTAQALALREGTKLGLEHVKKVLDVNEEFSRDLKGGTGYTDAMRSYT